MSKKKLLLPLLEAVSFFYFRFGPDLNLVILVTQLTRIARKEDRDYHDNKGYQKFQKYQTYQKKKSY